MKKRIHINMHKIRANKKHGTKEPVITVKTSKTNTYAHEVEILGESRLSIHPTNHYHVVLECGSKLTQKLKQTGKSSDFEEKCDINITL